MSQAQAPARRAIEVALEPFGSRRFSDALSTTIIGTSFLTFLIGHLIGQAGVYAIFAGLILFATLSVLGQLSELEWRGFLPISLIAFVGWTAVSLLLSEYHWLTLGGILAQFSVAVLGVYVALVRDFIQIVRIMGDVLRLVLGMSLALEIVVGLLFDSSFPLLGVTGSLGVGGPIQGVMGTRDDLGLVALIALVTFGTEFLTRSVSRTTGVLSVIGAVLVIILCRSGFNLGVILVLAIAALGLLGLRRVPASTQRYWLAGLGVVAIAGLIAAYAGRHRILDFLGATGALKYRLNLWRDLIPYTQSHELTGWGWVGFWPAHVVPFDRIGAPINHLSALSAYFDVWLQLGLIGLIAFVVFVGLAIVKSWILATQKRSRIFVWPALILLALLLTALTESGILVNWGWLVVVICAVKAAQHLPWRRALAEDS